MAKLVKKPATENLNEMLNRIRSENEALHRLIEAIGDQNVNIEKLKQSPKK